MFKSINNGELIEMDTEESIKSLSMGCGSYIDLTTINNGSTEPIEVEAEKEEELEYFNLDFKEENIIKAMVYSEIFGKPKSKRRKR